MHRILFILILTFYSSITDAQIQRSFWGLELGQSTKIDVRSYLSSNGIEFEDNFDGSSTICTVDELSLGGYSWLVLFEFHNNILYEVDMVRTNKFFSYTTGDSFEIDTQKIFNDLRKKISNKYNNCEFVSTPNPISLFVVRDNRTVTQLELKDDKTLSLVYVDRRIGRIVQSGDDL